MEQIELYKTAQSVILYTEIEKEMIYAKSTLMISKIAPKELLEKLNKIIKATYFKSGFEIHGDNSKEKAEHSILLTQAFMQEILRQHPEICIGEIEFAFNHGIYKKYGEYMGLSSVTFINWIDRYYEQRRELIFKQRQIESKQQKNKEMIKPSESEIEQRMKDLALKAFETYKEKGFYDDFGNCVYNYLAEKEIIKFTLEEKNKFMQDAKMKLSTTDKEKRFKDFLKLIEQKDKKTINVVISEAKRLALNNYFSTIKNLEICQD